MGWLRDQYDDISGHFKWALLGLLWTGMVWAVKHLAQYFPSVPSWVGWIVVFVGSTLAFFFVAQDKKTTEQSSQAAQQNAVGIIPATSSLIPNLPKPTFDSNAYFRTAYYSPVTAETEKNMGLIAREQDPRDPLGFLLKFVGVGLVSYLHDWTWFTIYKSQSLMLEEMNRKNGVMPLSEAKTYYDKAALEYPAIYTKYSFEQWLAYMKQQVLILQQPSNMLEITIKGKDFLKYLTHWGRRLDQRIG